MSGTNFSIQNRYKLLLPKEYAILENYCMALEIPGLTLGTIAMPTRVKPIYFPGDSLDIQEVNFTFGLDEDYLVWKSAFRWIESMKSLEDIEYDISKTSNFEIIILSAKYNPIFSIVLEGAFPTNMTPVRLASNVLDTEVFEFDISFKVNNIKVIDL